MYEEFLINIDYFSLDWINPVEDGPIKGFFDFFTAPLGRPLPLGGVLVIAHVGVPDPLLEGTHLFHSFLPDFQKHILIPVSIQFFLLLFLYLLAG